MYNKISYKFVFEIVGGISIIFGIFWSIQSQKHQDNWQRKVETIHVLESRDRSIMNYINKKTKYINNKDSLLYLSLNDTVLNQKIKKQLVFFESISIGSNVGVYDPEIIERFVGTSFIDFFIKMKPYITYIRKKNNNPNVYIEYETCLNQIKEIKNNRNITNE